MGRLRPPHTNMDQTTMREAFWGGNPPPIEIVPGRDPFDPALLAGPRPKWYAVPKWHLARFIMRKVHNGQDPFPFARCAKCSVLARTNAERCKRCGGRRFSNSDGTLWDGVRLWLGG